MTANGVQDVYLSDGNQQYTFFVKVVHKRYTHFELTSPYNQVIKRTYVNFDIHAHIDQKKSLLDTISDYLHSNKITLHIDNLSILHNKTLFNSSRRVGDNLSDIVNKYIRNDE